MAGNSRVVGKKINCTDEAFTPGLMVGPTTGNILKTKSKALAFTSGQMASGTRANG